MAQFVDAYNKTTGEKVRVPAHFFDVPSLCRNLRKTPKAKAAERSTSSTTPRKRTTRKTTAAKTAAATPQAPATGDEKE